MSEREMRARLARVVSWANARLSLDGFEPRDTPFVLGVKHDAAWEALQPGDLEAVPIIVCLCGSTRFWREFQRASLAETLAGKIVLSIGAASGTDDEHFGNLPREEYDRVKNQLDELHMRKIDLADEVLILNVGGYIGESTRRELNYAIHLGKPIHYLEESA